MQIAFFGDIMPSGDQIGNPIRVSKKLKMLMATCDVRVATLETAVGSYNEIDDIKLPKSEVAVWSKLEDLHKLKDLGINIVSLANNHACDCGVSSMFRLLDTLRNQGIIPIGAGHNIEEAMKPAVFEKNGESLAIIACCEDNPKSLGTLHFATEEKGGIYRFDEAITLPQIQELKKEYSKVAVVIHWGVEHRWLPEQYDVTIGKKMIDAGADMVIGGHPHHIQPMIRYASSPIFFSLGNFYFPDFCLDKVSNVYYPEGKELQGLPVFDWMAPDRRNFAMHYFWKYYGRLGMIPVVKITDDKIIIETLFSIYDDGSLSLSRCAIWHKMVLRLLAMYVGRDKSAKINAIITRLNYIVEYKILALFFKKYGFFKYLKEHNY